MITVTFNFTNEMGARLAKAYGRELNLFDEDLTDPENPVERDANMTEFKGKVIDMVLQRLHAQERKVLTDAVTVPSAEIS